MPLHASWQPRPEGRTCWSTPSIPAASAPRWEEQTPHALPSRERTRSSGSPHCPTAAPPAASSVIGRRSRGEDSVMTARGVEVLSVDELDRVPDAIVEMLTGVRRGILVRGAFPPEACERLASGLEAMRHDRGKFEPF